MKLLNFANLKFRLEEAKKIHFYIYYVGFFYKFRYWFLHPASFYFRIYPDIKWYKKNYHFEFIVKFKYLKEDIKDETA